MLRLFSIVVCLSDCITVNHSWSFQHHISLQRSEPTIVLPYRPLFINDGQVDAMHGGALPGAPENLQTFPPKTDKEPQVDEESI